ncbi:MAG: sugar phosphate isomerase/epimerase [Planctomycetota bacterium]|nr:sugar phosphate isomerase/epimerase [Planctomycetota bacterium]
MKLGTQLLALESLDRPAALKLAHEWGCAGLEVTLPVADPRLDQAGLTEVLATGARLRSEFQAHGLEVISLTPNLLLKQSADAHALERVARAADALGSRCVRMFFEPHVRWGGPNSKLDPVHAEYDGARHSREWMARQAESLSALMSHAERHALRFVFELHHGYVVNSASAALRLLDAYPPSRAGVLLDPGNMVFEGGEGWRNSVQLLGPYLAYVHCKNAAWERGVDGRWHRKWAGLSEGIANYPELLTALKDEGFAGYLSVEDLRRELPAAQRIAEGLAYLKDLWTSDVRVMPQ